MEKKEEYRERVPIAQWPELERKMGIIARMTSDPPLPRQAKEVSLEIAEEFESLSLYSEESAQRTKHSNRLM